MQEKEIKELQILAFGILDRAIQLKALSIEEQKLKKENSSSTSEVMKDFEQKFPSGGVVVASDLGQNKPVFTAKEEWVERLQRENGGEVQFSDLGKGKSIEVFSILMNDCDCSDCRKDKAEARNHLVKLISKQEEGIPVYENLERLSRRLKVGEKIDLLQKEAKKLDLDELAEQKEKP